MPTETIPALQEQQQPQEALAQFLTIPQVATLLACSPDSVQRLIKRGQLKAVKIGRLLRVPACAVQNLMK